MKRKSKSPRKKAMERYKEVKRPATKLKYAKLAFTPKQALSYASRAKDVVKRAFWDKLLEELGGGIPIPTVYRSEYAFRYSPVKERNKELDDFRVWIYTLIPTITEQELERAKDTAAIILGISHILGAGDEYGVELNVKEKVTDMVSPKNLPEVGVYYAYLSFAGLFQYAAFARGKIWKKHDGGTFDVPTQTIL